MLFERGLYCIDDGGEARSDGRYYIGDGGEARNDGRSPKSHVGDVIARYEAIAHTTRVHGCIGGCYHRRNNGLRCIL
jgi:hypothetical protein